MTIRLLILSLLVLGLVGCEKIPVGEGCSKGYQVWILSSYPTLGPDSSLLVNEEGLLAWKRDGKGKPIPCNEAK